MDIVAMTGHRPEGIQNETYTRTRIKLVFEQRRIERVIAGLAAGVDLWAAFEAIKLGIPVTSARPWAGHTPRQEDRKLYDYVVENSDEVVNVDNRVEFPGNYVYQKRNEWMVDNADKVFAIWNGGSGGTANCFKYALGKKPILRYTEGYGFTVYDETGREIVKQ